MQDENVGTMDDEMSVETKQPPEAWKLEMEGVLIPGVNQIWNPGKLGHINAKPVSIELRGSEETKFFRHVGQENKKPNS